MSSFFRQTLGWASMIRRWQHKHINHEVFVFHRMFHFLIILDTTDSRQLIASSFLSFLCGSSMSLN